MRFIKNNSLEYDYINLNRHTLRLIRRSLFKVTKKHIALCCGINAHTYSKVEDYNQSIRFSTLQKVFEFYIEALRIRGWEPRIE